MGCRITQKIITSNETHLIVEIYDLVISEGFYLNLSQKHRFKKVIYLAINGPKGCQLANRTIISKDLLYVINDHNMERKLSLIKKESDIFGLLFLGDGATLSRIPLFII